MIGWVAGGAGVAVGVLALWVVALKDDINDLNDKLDTSEAKARALATTNNVNVAALDACRVVNAENALARNAALDRADAAERAVALLRRQADATITIVREDASELRQLDDGTCRTLVDPLPVDFVDWVWGDTDLRTPGAVRDGDGVP